MQTKAVSRNWLGYICEGLVASGVMPSWEATEYLTANLFGEAPNPRLHETKAPYEAISTFLHRLYDPIVEAATRTVELPTASLIHTFTDISLMGSSAVLVVYFPGENRPHQLLLLDAARAWDLVFPHADAFNRWAEERYSWVVAALRSTVARVESEQLTGTVA